MLPKRYPHTMNVGNTGQLRGEKLFAFNKAHYGDKIREYRLKKGLNQPQLARLIGVTKNAIPNWEAGRTRPDTNYIPALCEALGISASTFFGSPGSISDLAVAEQRLVKNYRFLSVLNKRMIANLINTILDNEDHQLRERCENGFELVQRNELKASAGTGYYLGDDHESEYVYVRIGREACRADEIITVSGDSMSPTYQHGDDLFVEHSPAINPGEIGIFVVGGEGYVKEFQEDGLHSHNPTYPVMEFSAYDDVNCVGRVLGVVSKDQYATDLELEIIAEIQREKAGQKD